jgi:DNA-nicking Smr family endonuclease
MARRGKKPLTGEDQALWERVAKTATPLEKARRLKHAPHPGAPEADPPPPAREHHNTHLPPRFRIGEKAPPKHGAVEASPSLSESLAHSPVRMDHGAFRKMMRGKIKPEARLDLHGMTLAEAHPALIGFIGRAQAQGCRLVLVITGKGKDRDSGDPIPIRRGVLRHQVPAWLRMPPLGAHVLDIREAHTRHGGAGALYVYLKRQR